MEVFIYWIEEILFYINNRKFIERGIKPAYLSFSILTFSICISSIVSIFRSVTTISITAVSVISIGLFSSYLSLGPCILIYAGICYFSGPHYMMSNSFIGYLSLN